MNTTNLNQIKKISAQFTLFDLIKKKKIGPDRGLNPEPLAPKARIIPLDHQAGYFLLI